MTIPIGHILGDPERRYGFYYSTCACGLGIWGKRLPMLWSAHDVHLATVRVMSQGRHPSRRRDV